jgi:hypothetical protein
VVGSGAAGGAARPATAGGDGQAAALVSQKILSISAM